VTRERTVVVDRARFITLLGTSALPVAALRTPAGATSAPAVGQRVAQSALFATTPAAQPRQWVQYVMGSGVQYLKRIGFGTETTGANDRHFIETQVGVPGGSCNPNTLKKAYLDGGSFGALMRPYAVQIYVVKSGTFFTTWAGNEGSTPIGNEQRLLLLDAAYLYAQGRPATVAAVSSQSVRAAGKTFDATRIKATFAPAKTSGDEPSIKDMTLWLSPRVPLGVVRMEVGLAGIDPFTLHLDTYGAHYKSEVGMSLDEVKALDAGGGAS
jgi:hypothetical protein